MRPVEKSDGPSQIKKYGDAKETLLNDLGDYCSYCELFISLGADIDVEHKIAKNYRPDLENSWDNFLLSCTMCNSMKSRLDGRQKSSSRPARDFDENDYLWPDRDNTFLAFTYQENGEVGPFPTKVETLAISTIALFDLNRTENETSDNRLSRRKDSWRVGLKRKENFEKALENGSDEAELIKDLLLHVEPRGFWSVWMTIFCDYPSVRRALIERFPGTATDCFDDKGNPEERKNQESRI